MSVTEPIERSLLEDLGFRRGTGWDYEVWYHDCNYWVHFSQKFQPRGFPSSNPQAYVSNDEISAYTERREFLTHFLSRVREYVREGAQVVFSR